MAKTPDSPMRALKHAVGEAGSAADLGRAIGVTRQAIDQAFRKGVVPIKWCKKIEDAFGISRERLRPDIFG